MRAARALAALAGVVAFAAVVLSGAVPAAAAPIDVVVARGLDGVVPAGGIDVAVVEVESGADVPTRGVVELAGREHPIELAARGVVTVMMAARLPPGASSVTELVARVRIAGGDVEAVVPAARVVARPVIVIADAPAALLAAIEPWRQAAQLGEAVVLPPERVPATWTALIGAGAIVIDRPAAALAPRAAWAARRFLAAGGRVCRIVEDGAAPTCVQAAAVPVPRTAVRARLAPMMAAWAWIALALAAALLVAAAIPRRRGVVAVATLGLGLAAPLVATVRGADSRVAVRGVRAAAGGGEDWVAAELGVSDLAGAIVLGGDLWLEPTASDGGEPLDLAGLRGLVPGPGSWRVRGFVPAAAGGWAAALTRNPRPLPELP